MAALQKFPYARLAVRGQKLFSYLPMEVRNVAGCSVDKVKCILDRLLLTVPDELQIPGYTFQNMYTKTVCQA